MDTLGQTLIYLVLKPDEAVQLPIMRGERRKIQLICLKHPNMFYFRTFVLIKGVDTYPNMLFIFVIKLEYFVEICFHFDI